MQAPALIVSCSKNHSLDPDATNTMSSSLLVSLPPKCEPSASLLNAAHSASMLRSKEATFAPLFLRNITTSFARRHPRGSFGVCAPSSMPTSAPILPVFSTQPYILARCRVDFTLFTSLPFSSWSKNVVKALAASALDLKTCLMILRVGGRRLRAVLTGGSSGIVVRCTHGLSPGEGVVGIVYCESAASDRSQRFGTHTPTKIRHAARSRFALIGTISQYTCAKMIDVWICRYFS